ncbi:reverse transcriptase [Senna tora]|uniref:Reverse transcriptase n=1 Tax=Senna tora TaxID=362788 RepID=A0A834XEU8_9FABA|nr:reverse transcriptase [Senna tora]
MGFAGGMWLLWNPNKVTLEPTGQSFQELHSVIKLFKSKRNQLWNTLSEFAKRHSLPWLLIGDLNDYSKSTERFGGRPIPISRLQNFNNFINNCHFIDLGFTGPLFTWTNNHLDDTIIRGRIDRALSNQSWINKFPDSKVYHLPRSYYSDH